MEKETVKRYECMDCGALFDNWDGIYKHFTTFNHKGWELIDTVQVNVTIGKKPESDVPAKKPSQVTEVWYDEMTQTVRECKPEGCKCAGSPNTEWINKAILSDEQKSQYQTYVMGDWGKPTGMKSLGIKPRFLHEEHRMDAIIDAIERATTGYGKIRQEWIDEYNELAERRKK